MSVFTILDLTLEYFFKNYHGVSAPCRQLVYKNGWIRSQIWKSLRTPVLACVQSFLICRLL